MYLEDFYHSSPRSLHFKERIDAEYDIHNERIKAEYGIDDGPEYDFDNERIHYQKEYSWLQRADLNKLS